MSLSFLTLRCPEAFVSSWNGLRDVPVFVLWSKWVDCHYPSLYQQTVSCSILTFVVWLCWTTRYDSHHGSQCTFLGEINDHWSLIQWLLYVFLCIAVTEQMLSVLIHISGEGVNMTHEKQIIKIIINILKSILHKFPLKKFHCYLLLYNLYIIVINVIKY